MEANYKQRISFKGDLKEISEIICQDFNIGDFLDYELILVGYEDFNFSLHTTKSTFFVKIFAEFRRIEDCKRNVDILIEAIKNGVSLPKLYKSTQGYLHIIKQGKITLRLCVMDFIKGKDFFSSQASITKHDIQLIAQQTALINSINIKPKTIFNRSAIINFLQEFKTKSQYLDFEDLELIKPLSREYKKMNIEKLPYCFAHGDIIRTNIIKDENNIVWIVDFSTANNYPRILELAVLGCDVLFDKDSKKESEQKLKLALEEYQKRIKLTQEELKSLPFCIMLAHAMHVLCATYEKKVNYNYSKENTYFLNIGKSGLRQINESP